MQGIRPLVKASLRQFHNSIIPLKQQQESITANYRKLREHYDVPKYPIVLCHGFSGFDKLTLLAKPDLAIGEAVSSAKEAMKDEKQKAEETKRSLLELEYWVGIKEALQGLGSTVFIAKVPAFGDIESRARSLDRFITKQCKILRERESKSTIYTDDRHKSHDTFAEEGKPIKINLISHSMGGIDSRYLISKIHRNDNIYKVASLTTISTPHHGSECADFLVDLVGENPLLKQICPRSVYELTTASMAKFNKNVPDDPDVQYFSFGAKFNPRWYNLFNLTWRIMNYEISKENPKGSSSTNESHFANDGIVSVDSAKWGTYIGTLDQVDHLDLINWTNRARSFYDKIMWAKDPPFDPIALYLDIADKLAKRGL